MTRLFPLLAAALIAIVVGGAVAGGETPPPPTSLTLKQAEEAALRNQPTMREAHGLLEAAEGRVEEARSGYLPQVVAERDLRADHQQLRAATGHPAGQHLDRDGRRQRNG